MKTSATVSSALDRMFERPGGLYGGFEDLPVISHTGHLRRMELLDKLQIGEPGNLTCLDFGMGGWGLPARIQSFIAASVRLEWTSRNRPWRLQSAWRPRIDINTPRTSRSTSQMAFRMPSCFAARGTNCHYHAEPGRAALSPDRRGILYEPGTFLAAELSGSSCCYFRVL